MRKLKKKKKSPESNIILMYSMTILQIIKIHEVCLYASLIPIWFFHFGLWFLFFSMTTLLQLGVATRGQLENLTVPLASRLQLIKNFLIILLK